MNKGILALGAMLIFGVNTSSNAAKVWRGDIGWCFKKYAETKQVEF
ncbi:hypothetical protein EGT68_000040 [Acinetobacter junii]|nr:hypothetical protein [Acinetobacter junii]QXR10773.1 hypothetical protein EGT68_000040 [Acinetobacter junii]